MDLVLILMAGVMSTAVACIVLLLIKFEMDRMDR